MSTEEAAAEMRRRAVILERAVELCEQSPDTSNPGICISCGHEQDGCEPDARNRKCEGCGSSTVFGAEEAIIMLCGTEPAGMPVETP